jgi:hypothetical protein
MSETEQLVFTSIVALATAILAAVWNVGGWGALRRRTIRQELDIALALRAGPERQRLEQLALDRAALYVDDRTWVPLSEAQVHRRRLVTLLSFPVYAVLGAGAYFPGVLGDISQILSASAFVFFFAMLGYWIGRWLRYLRVRSRERRVVEARGRAATAAHA